MNRLGRQFPMGDTVASQLIRHDLARLILMALEQTPEARARLRQLFTSFHPRQVFQISGLTIEYCI
jgi:hypothetical protein